MARFPSLPTVTSVIALTFVAAACAQDAKPLSDAQIEANVLRALAGAPDLSTQNIQTATVFGVVTITGSTTDEAARTRAENIVARVSGVKKVVDQLTLGDTAATASTNTSGSDTASAPQPAAAQPGPGMVLQSDGSYAPADSVAQATDQPSVSSQQATEQGEQAQQQNQHPAGNYPPPAPPARPDGRRPMDGQYGHSGPEGYPMHPVERGQLAGRSVTVPSGSMLRVRINQGLSTKRSQVGMTFDGTVLSDVVADGAVAIPRGAMVHGTVVKVEDAGALKGRGDLALQINGLTLGGQSYSLVSDTWERNGRDKSLHTVNSALGLGVVGALFGAAAGGGSGAAIGAGVGAAAGVASSAASPDGKVIIPPEAVLTFHLAQPATVTTVSEAEMSRLSYAAGPGNPQPRVIRRRYPVYYSPYPYGPYGPY